MFTKIFMFEVHTQFRRPATYLYFATLLIFSLGTFATGALPLAEKEHINAPYVIALWCAVMSMVMALIGSSVMGLPIYRDIEYQTRQYYLTYPITETGYFWGRYFGAFLCLLFIASAMIIGAYTGTLLGPLFGWRYPGQYGPNTISFYLQPFFSIALTNLLFTASLFYGLVSLTRNVKVIYSGGVFLFLGYFLSFFFLLHGHSSTVVNLADPFAINGVMLQSNDAILSQKNNSLILISGTFFWNRVIWTATGLVILFFAYSRFSFVRLFKERTAKTAIADEHLTVGTFQISKVQVNFMPPYSRRTLVSLIKIELRNLVGDHYFWIILSSGILFLLLSFWIGFSPFNVPELPRTVILLSIFNDTFPFYIFIFILFYTGEVLHRERNSGFAVINDTLPPSNRLLNASKLLTLLILGIGMALIPVISGIAVQISKGFYQFNFPLYAIQIFALLIPRLLEIVVFCYVVHVLIDQKFAGHTIGLLLWVGLFFLKKSGILDYHLLLYAYTPGYQLSDMDGIGHELTPITWFNVYWLLFDGLLIMLSALCYHRGISNSYKDRISLIRQRFDANTKRIIAVVLFVFLSVGGFIYYNVSYLNNYLTQQEQVMRKVSYERTLKPYASLPLPKVTCIRLLVDLYPDKQQADVSAWVTIVNKTTQPISRLLIDGDELTDFNLKTKGQSISFSYPLNYKRGKFNFFRPESEPSAFRLYHFNRALLPGDSLLLEVHSSQIYTGFTNNNYAQDFLHNGIVFKGGLPGLGYDAGEELTDPFERKKYHLPIRKETIEVPQNDPIGMTMLKAGPTIDLLKLDITVSTTDNQVALAPGTLIRQWKQHKRNYFHYSQSNPGMYMPFYIISARYATLQNTVRLGWPINVAIYYHPGHDRNINHFISAYKDGLTYFSKAFGAYPFQNIRLAETNVYQNKISSQTTLTTYAEDFAWNANFTDPNQFDYLYFHTARALAQQWWRFEVAPNRTAGSLIIPEGLATYSALALIERKYGAENIRGIILDQLGDYLYRRTRLEETEHPLQTMNQPEQQGKAGVVLYGLKNLIGEDSLNVALRDFKKAYAFKNNPPYAGNRDLYNYLQKHVPDSMKYYLKDNWQQVSLYNNKVISAIATPIGKNNYQVTFTVNVAKTVLDKKAKELPVKYMNDYIDLGIFAEDSTDQTGRRKTNPLYLKRYKLTAGSFTLSMRIQGKPAYVGIDPFATLLDQNSNDNLKNINNH